ncbi:IS4 family transposase [Caldibacillus thermoamylovorans]|uniref:IS4 family transposase n=1 Tax=Caldibacillus thermoamylovorans TaxID=35841 RepID=UPI000D55F479|nr:transposase [Caldibacillus thermoamylovorans]AWI11130.1 IS4 family transposase [Caldibacillus thermoamylovorans]
MITKKEYFAQLPKEIKDGFSELQIGKHLRKAGIIKACGYSCLSIFQLLFLLVFQYRNWYHALQSKKAADLPGKDTIYRFLNSSTYNWRTFLLSLSSEVIRRVKQTISKRRVTVFIVDDSIYSRNRSKSVELLAKVFDHSTRQFVNGFQLLTLGWSDGFTFVPIDFALLSSANQKNRLNEIHSSIDKRTTGYKRRLEALEAKPNMVLKLVEHALDKGIFADYVLMDTWFTHAPLVEKIHSKGLFVIGMVKQLKQRYLFNGERFTLEQLYRKAKRDIGKKETIGSIHATLHTGLPVKIVFVRNRNNQSEWLAILSTDTTLSNEEIVRIYGMRWDIETFFKFSKSFLHLAKEFQGRSYDMMISHTTIVFTRYILIAWQLRKEEDPKTMGNLFLFLCDEVKEMDFKTALLQLISLFQTLAEAKVYLSMDIFQCQLSNWITSLPRYIKDCLHISVCES